MAIEKMVLLNMTFDRSMLDEMLFRLKEAQHFYPQAASKIVNNVKGVQVLADDNEYTDLLDRLVQIASDMKLELNHDLPYEHTLDIEQSNHYLKTLNDEISQIKKVQDELINEREENERTLQMLEHMSLSEVDFDQLINCHYLKVGFGRIKKENLDKMRYFDDHPFLFHRLGKDHQYIWFCYIVTHNIKLEVDNVLKALGFDEIKIPSFVHGTLEDAKKELNEEIKAMSEYILRMDQKMTVLRETHKIDLLKLYSTAYELKKISSYKQYVVDYEFKCAIYGFIAKRDIQSWKDKLKDIEGMEYQELPTDILSDRDVYAPTVVQNAKIVKPFEMINKVKSADGIDMTIAIAILYYAVFMLFLGDLGLGAILILLGLCMRKQTAGHLLLSLGVATCIGGLIYGQAFYVIQLYNAISFPLSVGFKVLDGLVLLGVGTMTFNIIKKIINENSTMNRIFSIKGLCGLICLYTLIVYLGCVYEANLHISFVPIAIIIVSCLSLTVVNSIIKKKLKS